MSGKGLGGNLKRTKQPVHIYRSLFEEEIDMVAAPPPLVRRGNKAACNWSVVYVVDFLVLLLLGEDVEVIKSRLPEASAVALKQLA